MDQLYMSLTVYEMRHSPYCIPITQALEALSVPFETVQVPAWDRSSVIRLTKGAYYEVPVLEHDGRIIFESGPTTTDIAAYVDQTFARGRLFPKQLDGLQDMLVQRIENEVESATFKVVDPFFVDSIERLEDRVHTIRHKERKFGRGCVDRWRADLGQLRAQADALLEPFEQMLQNRPFLLGEEPVYADFALFGIIGNLTYKRWNTLSDRQLNISAWQARLKAFRF